MRSSLVTFSPGTGSPVEVTPVEAQPFRKQIVVASIAKIDKYFISDAKGNRGRTFLQKKSQGVWDCWN
jgi:hypothetical protein